MLRVLVFPDVRHDVSAAVQLCQPFRHEPCDVPDFSHDSCLVISKLGERSNVGFGNDDDVRGLVVRARVLKRQDGRCLVNDHDLRTPA